MFRARGTWRLEFDWDEGNREKCQKHGLSVRDIEVSSKGNWRSTRTLTIPPTTMKKKLPKLTSDAEAEAFIDNADLTEFDLSTMRELRFEFGPKTERINMRLPKPLLDAVKAQAARPQIPYQRFIRAVLEQAVARRERSK